jgi:hypothetical protein
VSDSSVPSGDAPPPEVDVSAAPQCEGQAASDPVALATDPLMMDRLTASGGPPPPNAIPLVETDD